MTMTFSLINNDGRYLLSSFSLGWQCIIYFHSESAETFMLKLGAAACDANLKLQMFGELQFDVI